jgi:hypothetical protein
MRTTLDVDDDVLLAVKERARREKRSAGAVLSELARQGLHATSQRTATQPEGGRFGFAPLSSRGGTVSNALIDQLRDEDDE